MKEHLIITSGTVRPIVHTRLRENERRTLLASTLDVASEHDDLAKLRARLRAKGADIAEVVRSYLAGLDKLTVWSGADLDAHMGAIASSLADVLDQFFRVHQVLRDVPRPDFDERRYLDRSQPPGGARERLLWMPTGPPENVRVASHADPLRSPPAQPGEQTTPRGSGVAQAEHDNETDLVTRLASTPAGAVRLVVGPGGAGKSTTLEMLVAEAAHVRAGDVDAPLPILVPLGSWQGSFDKLVNRCLEALEQHGRGGQVAHVLREQVDQLLNAATALERGEAAHVMRGDFDLLEAFPETPKLAVRMWTQQLTPLLARLQREIGWSEEDALKLMGLDIGDVAEPLMHAVRALVSVASADSVDARLVKLAPLAQADWLPIVAGLGFSDARAAVLQDQLRMGAGHPAIALKMEKSMKDMWCKPVAEAAVRGLIAYPVWDVNTKSSVGDIVNFLAQNIASGWLADVVEPHIGGASGFALELLEFLRDVILARRPPLA